jgi:hypothetical protein
MNERIRELAEQAGFEIHEGKFDVDVYVDGISIYNRLKLFANLIRADEREACAMECIKLANKWTRLGAWGENNEFHECADSILARGEK